jgi:hypothetical protein
MRLQIYTRSDTPSKAAQQRRTPKRKRDIER